MAETKADQKLDRIVVEYRTEGSVRPYPLTMMDIHFNDLERPVRSEEVCLESEKILGAVKCAVARVTGWQWATSKINEGDVCVEIGVDHGDGIQRCLARKPRLVMGVDPWLSFDWDSWFSQPQDHMDARFGFVKNRFKDEKVTLVRDTSDRFFETLPSEFKADWWFIDGDHREDPCYRDLVGALKFSKSGSWIFVDDVDCKRWAEPIRAAITRFMLENDDRVSLVWKATSPAAIRVK